MKTKCIYRRGNSVQVKVIPRGGDRITRTFPTLELAERDADVGGMLQRVLWIGINPQYQLAYGAEYN
jgi:hypothetical protein